MNQNICLFSEMRCNVIYDFFIPVDDSIVQEPVVSYPEYDSHILTNNEVFEGIEDIYRSREPQEARKSFSLEEARKIGTIIGIDWSKSPFKVEQYKIGLDVELEHGRIDPQTNVTGDDPIMTGKIAFAHLKEFPDYYIRLEKLEKEAMEYWKNRIKK